MLSHNPNKSKNKLTLHAHGDVKMFRISLAMSHIIYVHILIRWHIGRPAFSCRIYLQQNIFLN